MFFGGSGRIFLESRWIGYIMGYKQFFSVGAAYIPQCGWSQFHFLVDVFVLGEWAFIYSKLS